MRLTPFTARFFLSRDAGKYLVFKGSAMTHQVEYVHESIKAAIKTIQNFVKTVTGKEATQEEIARALTRYFVLNEIKAFIEMERASPDA